MHPENQKDSTIKWFIQYVIVPIVVAFIAGGAGTAVIISIRNDQAITPTPLANVTAVALVNTPTILNLPTETFTPSTVATPIPTATATSLLTKTPIPPTNTSVPPATFTSVPLTFTPQPPINTPISSQTVCGDGSQVVLKQGLVDSVRELTLTGKVKVFAHCPLFSHIKYINVTPDDELTKVELVCPNSSTDITNLFSKVDIAGEQLPHFSSQSIYLPSNCRIDFIVKDTRGGNIGIDIQAVATTTADTITPTVAELSPTIASEPIWSTGMPISTQTGQASIGDTNKWVVFQTWDGRSTSTVVHGLIEPGWSIEIPSPLQGTIWTVSNINRDVLIARVIEMRKEAVERDKGPIPPLIYVGTDTVPEQYTSQLPNSWNIRQ